MGKGKGKKLDDNIAHWAILDEDGKVLGRFLTEEDAEKALRWGTIPEGVAIDWIEEG
jgi:hypothetical protein